jgi:hypothetical protein
MSESYRESDREDDENDVPEGVLSGVEDLSKGETVSKEEIESILKS